MFPATDIRSAGMMITGWVRHSPSSPTRPSTSNSHTRSYSAAIPSNLFPNRMARAISTSALPNNSSTSLASSVSARSGNDSNDNNESLYNDDDESMSTIPDPRTKGSFSANGSSPPHHPDLNDEVATLSNKLINAINHQTNLDDTLNKTRQQLADSRSRIRQLELEAEGHQNDIADGTLVLSVDVIAERKKLLALIKDETDRRGVAEKEKKAIELELETLTTALFEEANKMVTSAREEAAKDHEEMQRKNEQLKAQLSDTKILLSSQEEQLAGLKLIMEQMAEELQKQKDQMAEQQKKLDEHQKQMAMDREELIETKEQVGAQKEMLQKGEAVLKEHKEALTEMKSGCAGEISDLKDECEAVRKKLVISEEALSRRGSLQDMASASASTRASVEIGVQTPPAMEGDSSKAEQERHSEVPEIKVEDGEQVSPTASPKAAPASEPASESAKAQEEAQEAKADTKREPEPKLEVKPQMQMQ